jgi:hypothetical protein
MNRFIGQFPDADFGPWQVGHNRHGQTHDRRCPPDCVDVPGMAAELTMGKIQPGHVHPRRDQLRQHLGRTGRRSDGTDNFSFIDWKQG